MEYAPDWLVTFLASEPLKDLVTMSAILWGIWYTRNKRIFDDQNVPPAVVRTWCLKQVEEWQQANKRSVSTRAHDDMLDNSDKKWKKLREGQLKVNVDGAVVEGRNFFSVGMALRDHHGQFIAGKTLKIAGGVSVMEAELIGILEALAWAREVSEAPHDRK
ncbi:uncharacterized protein LOC141714129 [Apium graveolens]|uniref:uncharacterized protein LOC141714129 n=1 Tax=Apium graveolens TaxID=4045 RepID=UPI003D7BB813